MTTSYLLNMRHSQILVVLYENRQSQTETQLRGVMDFLNLDFCEEDMNCVLDKKEGSFKRPDAKDIAQKVIVNFRQMNKTKEKLFNLLKSLKFNYK